MVNWLTFRIEGVQARVCESSANASRHRHPQQMTRFELACLSTLAPSLMHRSFYVLPSQVIGSISVFEASFRIFLFAWYGDRGLGQVRGFGPKSKWTATATDTTVPPGQAA